MTLNLINNSINIEALSDTELIRYIEGQSLILNEFGMDSEYVVRNWVEFGRNLVEVYENTNFIDGEYYYSNETPIE